MRTTAWLVWPDWSISRMMPAMTSIAWVGADTTTLLVAVLGVTLIICEVSVAPSSVAMVTSWMAAARAALGLPGPARPAGAAARRKSSRRLLAISVASVFFSGNARTSVTTEVSWSSCSMMGPIWASSAGLARTMM